MSPNLQESEQKVPRKPTLNLFRFAMLLALFSVCRVLLLVFVDDLVALLDLVLNPVEGLRGHKWEATL